MHSPAAILSELKERFGGSDDYVSEILSPNPTGPVELCYLKSMTDPELLHKKVRVLLYECKNAEELMDCLVAVGAQTVTENDTRSALTEGKLILCVAGRLFALDIKLTKARGISEALTETVILGPQEALTEDLSASLNQIRSRYTNQKLVVEKYRLNTRLSTELAVLYDADLADPKVLNSIKEKIRMAGPGTIQSVGQLEKIITGRRFSLFPIMMITERPDRITYNLAQGKVVILLAGTPFALIGPTVLFDFMSSMEDLYQAFWVSRFLVVLRYSALIVSMTLPALYVGAVSYNPELFKVQLALSIAGSRAGVPYPSFVEILLMLVMMELLVEASIRLPKTISSAATTVGGLILGQAATDASLISNIMIIIVAAVAISNFVIPINALSFAMRTVKYLLLLTTTLYGLPGLITGFLVVTGYLVNLDSFNEPYLKIHLGRDRS